jgi:hypothetical protein
MGQRRNSNNNSYAQAFLLKRNKPLFLVEPNIILACTQKVTVGHFVKQDNALTKTVNTNTNVYIATRNMPLTHVKYHKPTKLPTLINLEQLSFILKSYDSDIKTFVLSGFTLGFHLGSDFNKPSAKQCKHHKSALDNRVIVAEKIRNVIKANLNTPLFQNSHVHHSV